MNVLVLNTSPKQKGGASRFFAKLLKAMLLRCKITTCDIRNHSDYEQALSLLGEADAVVISSPLYVDGIPAHMLPFLLQAEQLCTKKQHRFKLYVLSNCGFVEGKQNSLHLKMYEAWSACAGVEWGGGLGIGGGVMLHILCILFPILALLRLVRIVVVALPAGAQIWPYLIGLLVVPFLTIGLFVCLAVLAQAIRHKKQIKNLYTRPLVPSFVFLVFADLFMLISAAFNRVLPHKLFKRIDLPEDFFA